MSFYSFNTNQWARTNQWVRTN